VTLKNRSNKKKGIKSCILTKCTYDKNLEMIQPLVQELEHFLCFQFCPAGGQTKNQTGSKTRVLCHVSLLDTHDTDLEMIHALVQASVHLFGFSPLVTKPGIRSNRNLVCQVSWPRATYVPSFRSISPAVTKRALLTAQMNFDFCDLEKQVKPKTLVLCHASLLHVQPVPFK
jgi:hypothetical protein